MKLTRLTALLTVVYMLALITTTTAVKNSSAEEPKKSAALPSKLSELDLTKLKLAVVTKELAKHEAMNAARDANTTIAASDAEIDRICKEYKIERAQLSRSVSDKGEITRQPEPPKSDKPAAKPSKTEK